jgi:hypothetical protein
MPARPTARPFRPALALALALALGLGLGPGRAASRTAATAEETPAEFRQANAALRDALARQGASAPDMHDPAYAKTVSRAFDVGIVEVSKGQPLPALLDLCDEVVRTEVSYTQFGLNKGGVGAAPQSAERMLSMQKKNEVTFQDELAAARRFSIACMAVKAEKMTDVVGRLKPEDMTPARRAGLEQVQRRLLRLVSDAVLSQMDPIRPGNREIILDALVRDIDPLAAAMTRASRRSAVDKIDQVLTSQALPHDTRAKLGAVRRVLDRADCTGLCAVS